MTKKGKHETVEDKQQEVYSKLFFLGLVVALILITQLFMMVRNDENVSSERGQEVEKEADEDEGSFDTSVVLGEPDDRGKELQEDVAKRSEDVKEQVLGIKNQTASAVQELIEQGKTTAEEKTQDLLYSSTLKPIIEKVNQLPEDQQEYIRENICQ